MHPNTDTVFLKKIHLYPDAKYIVLTVFNCIEKPVLYSLIRFIKLDFILNLWDVSGDVE